jgi:hypothetical protein
VGDPVGDNDTGLAVEDEVVGFAEVGTGVAGFDEVGLAEVGTEVVGFAEVGFAEVGTEVVGFTEVGTEVVGFAVVGTEVVGFVEVGTAVGVEVVGFTIAKQSSDRKKRLSCFNRNRRTYFRRWFERRGFQGGRTSGRLCRGRMGGGL